MGYFNENDYRRIAKLSAFFFVVIFAYQTISVLTSIEYRREKILEESKERLAVLDSKLVKLNDEVWHIHDERKALMACITANSNTGTFVDCDAAVEVMPKAEAKEPEPVAVRADPTTVETKQYLPSELFWPTKASDKCYVTQTENEHVIPKNGGMFATDIACNFGEGLGKRAEVYAPDLRGEEVMYRVAYVWEDSELGSFIHLVLNSDGQSLDESFIIGHTETKLKEGDFVKTGERIGQMILNGATTGWHVHFEYRRLSPTGVWMSQRYFTGKRDEAVDNKRKKVLKTDWKEGDKFYFTKYDLGDVNQNDSAPCHGASGKNLCDLEKSWVRTIALTVDVRKSLGINFGDKVRLEGPCGGVYEVHDEMNARFRYANIMREGYPIKGDIPSCSGGVHAVFKN